jgi:hypothetical protein
MKRIIIFFAFLISISAHSQKHSLTIKTGHTSSVVDNYNATSGMNATGYVYTKPLRFPEVGIGYTFKPKNWIWFSLEPGMRIAGHKYKNFWGETAVRSNLYFNSPIVSTFNIGREKLIVAMDLGYNSNFKISGTGPSYVPEILIGTRLGYKITNRISLEFYYRYGEGLKPFYSDKPLTTNYISLQTRMSLGK